MRIHVVINDRARRGGESTARALEQTLPSARVHRTSSIAELDVVAERLLDQRPDLVLAAGGDGTALALVNAIHRARERGARAADERSDGRPNLLGAPTRGPLLRLGLLKLGTGNGWARSQGAPRLGAGLARLARFVDGGRPSRELPMSRFDLVDVEGTLAHFAGTGWDAELIDDFHAQKDSPYLPEKARHGLVGYLNGLFTRAVPRNLKHPRVEVEVVNTGAPAMGVDARGRPFELPDTGPGTVMYRGPYSVCGAATSTQWGFGFRAFPFARLVQGRFNMRVYTAPTMRALVQAPVTWAGRHPMPDMHTWLLTSAKVRFSRSVPLQAGGDLLGHRSEVDYSIAGESVEVLDWRAFGRLTGAPERLLKDAVIGHLQPALSLGGIIGE
jgi:diacylglycerol kinase family enzyme